MSTIILDLDGTIADDRHRLYLITGTKPNYSEYHAACEHDPVMNRGLITLVSKKDYSLLFITSRPEKYREQTWKWLLDAGFDTVLFDSDLLMRPDGDLRPSPVLKLALLEKSGVDPHEIVCAFDDRADVLQMYRDRLGIPTVLVGYESKSLPAPPSAAAAPPELLRAGAVTFEARNAVYGETYETFGRAMAGLFPNGLEIKPGDIAAFNRLGVYVQVMTKVARYATSLSSGGHVDSAHDAMVYSAMLEYLTRKGQP